MRQAVFRTPQTILYGKQSFEKIDEEAARRGKKALIVTDKIMAGLGNADACQRILQEAGVKSAVYAGVNAEPVDHYVSEALTVFQQESCDLLVSLGGGSCIDTAKAVAVVATNGGYIGDYMGGRKMAEKPPVPHIAVPTTAGTGSEATDATIITNTARDVKMMIKQPAFMPAVAIVDPVLSKSSPKPVTAATGVDALSHAIEAYISRRAHPLTDTLALSAMRLIIPHLKSAYEDGENMEARDAMSLGSLQAGMAFSNASVCLVHGMSRPIGALFHVPHGISNAMLLPAVLEFSKSACLERLADIGNIFSREVKLSGKEAADLAVSAVKQLCLDLNIPNLSGWGIPQQSFESAINKMASDALASGSPQNNPRVPSQKEIEDLYLVCYDYQFSGKVQARG
ncbi:iron-containing alcohol dehydrogenase [Bacillus coagulans]|uniref:iron-containing alcohol dehydrogenase n=1 Tax=Heyndrickxia coagulans TaxID=1398 RepID=UPI001376A5FA|nr:iron-containing alcohol dehydrogenase [Heyndrickxia coagulans]NCG67490.1 iron-containing alcohol dehydrogenase [Heyndrickxia coagulans]